ncbi:contactin-1a [Musca vetustissima]|uniref:contactin-1a n=1 Tax=Musca vetustissima TaxID=27455 RepID=UPI002AB6949F|nr:contactin-1a [Musca vetustissima]
MSSWVLTVLTSTIKYNEYVTDKGENISIPCIADGNIMWVKENGSNNNTIIQTGKYLILRNVSASDRGIYVCFAAVTPRKSIATTTKAHDDDATDSNSRSVASIPTTKTTETASPPASASANNISSSINETMPATSSSSNDVTNIHSTTDTTSATSSIPSSSHNTSSKSNNNNSTSSNIRSSSNPSEEILITTTTTTTLLPSPEGGEHEKQKDDVDDDEDAVQEFQAFQKINLTVRTPPGPVSQLYFKASTILGFLVWRFNKTNSGGYPVRSFTAEFRNVSYDTPPYNSSFEHQWSRMDPINIAPNVRQMEVYRLEPNTTYEFRMWANNHLGSGEVVTTNVTTLPETKEEDLIRLIQPDLDNFDPRIWIVAVSIVLGTFVILAIGLCIVLTRECYQSSQAEFENGWDSIELIPNIILNPGFSETEDGQSPPITAVPLPTFTRTIVFGDESDSCESESDHEPRMEKFKRKLSVFFTDPTIKRI